MKLTSDQWRVLSALLDQALELPPSQRAGWLAGNVALSEMAPGLSEVLRRMLECEAETETAQLLGALSGLVQHRDPASERLAQRQAGESVGVYRLVRELGRGGMGAVWLAERTDGLLKRPVALKLPHLSGESGALRERFARERDILAALNHPNIARLYDAGFTPDGQPFLALEYVEGRTLSQECAARGLGLRQRLELFGQVLEAVKYAHAHLVVHRDLKPSNILVTPDGQVKLLDFGIAKLVAEGEASETELTQLGGRAMTPDYASPEQILGQPITTAGDVYSLGVLLYELLCGQRPYRLKRTTRGALEEAIVAAEPAAPSAVVHERSLARELRGDLDTIVLKALKKKPAQRYDSAAALAEDLRRHRGRLPVLAQPDSRWYRWRRFVARNWVPVSAIGGVFVALVAGTGVALWQAHSARQAQARADEVKRFISSIFSDTGPAQGKGGMATAAELLVRASQRVPHELAADPSVAAELDLIIGTGLLDLGEADKAREQLERALKRDAPALGEHTLPVLRLKVQLVVVSETRGQWVEAQRPLADIVADLRRLGRAGAGDLVEALRELAFIQFRLDSGNAEQGLALAREAVAAAERWLAPDDPQRLQALSSLASLTRANGRYAEALPLAQRATELARQVRGALRPDVYLSETEADLVRLLSLNDRPGEAVPLARQVLADYSALMSADTGHVAFAFDMLAQALSLSGHLTDAEVNERRAIEILGHLRPRPDADQAILHQRLAQNHLEGRRPLEASAEMQIAEQMFTAAGGDRTAWRVRERQLDRAEALIYLARCDEAAALVDAVSTRLGDDPTHQWSRVAQLWSQALRLGSQARASVERGAEALPRAQTEQLGPRSSAALGVALAQALLDTGQASAARPLLVKALAQYQTAQVDLSPRVADALVGLGRADLDLANPESALTSLKRAHAFWQQFDSNSLWAAEAAFWYGRALRADGQADAGRSLIASSATRLMRSPFAVHRQLAATEPTMRG